MRWELRYADRGLFGDFYNSDRGLNHMCEYGAERFREGEDVVIKFECFNELEASEVKEIMSRRFPDVKFFTTHMVFK